MPYRVLALVVVLVGCSPQLPVYVADDDPAVGATLQAVEWWNGEIGYAALTVRVLPGTNSAHVAVVDPGSIQVRTVDQLPRELQGIAFPGAGVVLVERDTLDDVAAVANVAHELGHAMGLFRHSGSCDVYDLDDPAKCLDGDDPGSADVMFASYFAQRAFREAYPDAPLTTTRAQRRRVRAWLAARAVVAP